VSIYWANSKYQISNSKHQIPKIVFDVWYITVYYRSWVRFVDETETDLERVTVIVVDVLRDTDIV